LAQLRTIDTAKKNTVIVGYSGHAYVVLDILLSQNYPIIGYCDSIKKVNNPFNLTYLGQETNAYPLSIITNTNYFVCIGDNGIRAKVQNKLTTLLNKPALNVLHDKAACSAFVDWHPQGGILVAANAVINPFVKLGKGVIVNISASIDHECILGDFVHIAPSAVLCGNVKVGNNSFIGANSVIKANISIGANVVIAAGSVVNNNIPDNVIFP
jgi:sugar O-acyltransferase (sialic acid O-acetyltransferase NeuD family)